MNIALSLFFQSPLHRISDDLFTCYLRSCRRQTQKTEQCGHQGLVTEPNGSRHAEDRPRLAAATAIGTPINPRPRTRFRVMREIENSAQILRLLGKRDKIVPGKSSPRSGSDYCHVGFSIQDWVEWMPANGFTSGASGCVGNTRLPAPASKAAREFFTLAGVRTPVYIAQTQPEDATWGKNAPRPQDYNDPDPLRNILILSQAFKVDPTQSSRE